MKPVAIFRHACSEGPGYLADFLDARGIPWQLIAVDAGDPLPASARDYSGLVFMGGPMSVHDDLPWIAGELALIREAAAADIPLLGHCLGGQLMAAALGGSVVVNPVKEIGWGELTVADHADARRWFGDCRSFVGFHWHGEAFTLPPGAVRILTSPWCDNQAFVLGKHLGMQCHIEMTEPMVPQWCALGSDYIAGASASPGVQSRQQMCADLPARVARLNALADAVYAQWADGLAA
jgi:GMP synthase-like glutamine amidotransferase